VRTSLAGAAGVVRGRLAPPRPGAAFTDIVAGTMPRAFIRSPAAMRLMSAAPRAEGGRDARTNGARPMKDPLRTRFAERFGLTVPIASAPMALASGGRLAQAVSDAGALGFVGGGYGDADWTRRELALADARSVGCGFITWAIEADCRAFDIALEFRPRALFLSFGDPRPFARRARAAGIVVFCQVQTLAQLPVALEAQADVIVAQGTEAGGHGMQARTTMSFVPELRDRLDAQAPGTLLLAAGGIADGRGLAATLALGADGALVGTRLWACAESLAAEGAKQRALAIDGDATCRSRIFDVLRRKNWPREYSFRAYRNAMHRRWEGLEAQLEVDPAAARAEFDAAAARGDYDVAHVTVGEAIGLVRDLPPAAALVERIAAEARAALRAVSSVS
jgi:nitronate monooxygenase